VLADHGAGHMSTRRSAGATGSTIDGSATGAIGWTLGGSAAGGIAYRVLTGAGGAPVAVLLDYAITPRGGESRRYSYRVAVVTRRTAAGIVQRLWRCPLTAAGDVPCDRLARTLYLPPGAAYFGCRHCHRLVYRSAQTHAGNTHQRLQRLLAQADRLLAEQTYHDQL
jgi:hypothetical protein